VAILYSCDSASNTFACLLAVDADTLNNASNAITSSAFYGTFIFVPVVDGTFIVERPTVTIDQQVVNGVSLRHATRRVRRVAQLSLLGRTPVDYEYFRRQDLHHPL
jgi:hypothetical protein